LYQQWTAGKINDQQFLQAYDEMAKKWLQSYRSSFAAYLEGE
jgi:hypothetical protein